MWMTKANAQLILLFVVKWSHSVDIGCMCLKNRSPVEKVSHDEGGAVGFIFKLSLRYYRELKQRRRRRHENGKKKNNKRFRLAKQQPCTSITLYAHSLPSLRDYDVNLPHLTFFWRTSTQDNDPLLLLLNFDTIVYNPTPDKFANIWRIERDGINAMKFEPARTHFLTDVFVAVAVVVA